MDVKLRKNYVPTGTSSTQTRDCFQVLGVPILETLMVGDDFQNACADVTPPFIKSSDDAVALLFSDVPFQLGTGQFA